ncbi:MAG TPA: DUF2497 domain-containing protein [Rhizomicrobium sp.]|nr:DUF2497 domain-containing protein [Rhizomicrobium sp.]
MASSPQHEPTMEEILASIRKIISEDSTEAQPAPAAAASAPAEAAPIDADVLDLTQEIHEEPVPPPPVVAAAPPPAPEPVVAEPEPVIENDVEFQTIEEESPVSSEAQATAPHEGIFSDKTRKALEDSFSSIPAQRPAPVAEEAPAQFAPAPAADGSSVQAVFEKAVRDGFEPVLHKWLGDNSDDVVEKLKPLVRQWMDDHFPALLEGAVRAEVERVARARH